ncbi:MAG: hypothetical protein GXP53_07755 [Deltaproteobacteria bacterium]|nr:hypothetical protein [Deltaproteobacteria bacterium]
MEFKRTINYDGLVKSPSAALRDPGKASTYKKYAFVLSRIIRSFLRVLETEFNVGQ